MKSPNASITINNTRQVSEIKYFHIYSITQCGYAFELGIRFTIDDDPTERTYTCKDRGSGPYHWVDIFFADSAAGWAWQEIVGTTGMIHLERSN